MSVLLTHVKMEELVQTTLQSIHVNAHLAMQDIAVNKVG